ncbi:MAG: alpha-L-rhamnosidase C-terminal domain-containing protein [Verrucomicrobiota bacterium]|nr:alpha-L-rhamnosidase C-terminal domain-containing protein [Verrucomicrobiota bacterium]
MNKPIFPIDIKGRWIWLSGHDGQMEQYLFFRREFPLEGTPGYADFWIAAKSSFHVYVNGRHLFQGASLQDNNDAYAYQMDITYCLQTGKNIIAVLVHATDVPRYAHFIQKGALWAQVNMDGEAKFWTDERWQVKNADCYKGNRSRISEVDGFTEKFDFNLYPSNWNDTMFSVDPYEWSHPDIIKPLGEEHGEISPANIHEMDTASVHFESIVLQGTSKPVCASTNISFSKIFCKNGVYCGQTFFYSFKSGKTSFEIYTDDPYKLFVNGECLKIQGESSLSSGDIVKNSKPDCFMQASVVPPEGELYIEEGWNTITLVQQIEKESAGATINFPEKEIADLRFKREIDEEASPGWSLTGPLKIPFSNVTGILDIYSLKATPYVPLSPLDQTVNLKGYDFSLTSSEKSPVDLIELRKGDYCIVDLEDICFGFPRFSASGSEGDILNIVIGDIIQDNKVPLFNGNKRNVTTIVLDGETHNDWMAFRPAGMKYMMIVATEVEETILIRNLQFQTMIYNFENAGAFECSDEVMNGIWNVCKKTLKETMNISFMDSPTGGNVQYIADSMIQSLAAFCIFGDSKLARKSLREFPFVQFETGELPTMYPSDYYFNIPDFILLWPVWLQQYILSTGDISLVQELLPHIMLLFTFLEKQTPPNLDVLCNMKSNQLGTPFLDHEDIDRKGIVTGLNAIYCRSLLSTAWLLDEANLEENAHDFRKKASRIAKTIRDLTWDQDKGLFADSWRNLGKSDSYTHQTNILAVYGGIATNDQIPSIMETLFPDSANDYFQENKTYSPYFKYFLLETLFALGERTIATKIIKQFWGGMIEDGATTWPELYCPKPTDGKNYFIGNKCMGYGVSPSLFFFREIAGIRPASPGYSSVYFNPSFDSVEQVKAHIPTPHGRINVEWEAYEGKPPEIVLDANYPLDVIPLLDPDVAAEAIFHVSDDITICHK